MSKGWFSEQLHFRKLRAGIPFLAMHLKRYALFHKRDLVGRKAMLLTCPSDSLFLTTWLTTNWFIFAKEWSSALFQFNIKCRPLKEIQGVTYNYKKVPFRIVSGSDSKNNLNIQQSSKTIDWKQLIVGICKQHYWKKNLPIKLAFLSFEYYQILFPKALILPTLINISSRRSQ